MNHLSPLSPQASCGWFAVRIGLFALMVSFLSGPAQGQPTQRIRLKDGSFSLGQLLPSETPGVVAWQSEGFADAFQFELGAVRGISPAEPKLGAPGNATGQVFELASGEVVSGALVSLDDDWAVVQSPSFGEVKIRRDGLRALVGAKYAGKIIYSGPAQDGLWQSTGDQDDWEIAGGALISNKAGGTLIGRVGLTAKCRIALTLSWDEGLPDFVVSLGTDPKAVSARAEDVQSAARLEVWDADFALLRETESDADIELLEELQAKSNRLSVIFYLDQTAGVVIACDEHGRRLKRIEIAPGKEVLGTAVHLSNVGRSLRLERFEVREWDGYTTEDANTGVGTVLTVDGNLAASIAGYEAETGELILFPPGDDGRLPLTKLLRGVVRPPILPADEAPAQAAPETKDAETKDAETKDAEAEPTILQDNGNANESDDDGDEPETVGAKMENKEGDAEQAEDKPDEARGRQVEIVFFDRSRLQGQWLPSVGGLLAFHSNALAAPVRFAPDKLLGFVETNKMPPPEISGRRGDLKFSGTQLGGALSPSHGASGESKLFWKPIGSQNACEILGSVSGAIVYRKSLPKKLVAARTNKVGAVNGPFTFFQGRASTASRRGARKTTPFVPEIVFRAGDVIQAEVERIGEKSGVQFKSAQSTTTIAPHDQVQSITLRAASLGHEPSPEKLARLMTVPRSMKPDPPTHLLVATTGDFLRGRLIAMDSNKIQVEVRLERIEIAREQVARIIWLHDREWEKQAEEEGKENAAASSGADDTAKRTFQVHAIRSGDKGLTFVPQAMMDETLQGVSGLLGECSVKIEELDQVLFGRDVVDRVREFYDDPWTLALAQLPKVYADAAAGASASGAQSEFVGKAAPEFGLKTLDGERFRLSEQHDRVVVLDFWASWCGPCMKTMPLVEDVVREIGEDKVHLVAVNIQESGKRVRAAVERLGVDATVLLDVDGEVASAYKAQAIPQTVIIDRDGNVTHLFVGGGSRFVAGFREALQELTQE